MSNFLYLKTVGKGPERHGPRTQRQQPRKESSKGVLIDLNADPSYILRSILENIIQKDGTSKVKKLAYLNAFVKFIQERRPVVSSNKTFDMRDILICLRVPLVDESPVVRVAALRVIRYLLCSEEDVITMNSLGIPSLVVRSLDIVLNNSGERIQAARLAQRILALPRGACHFPRPITRALLAIAFDGQLENDKLHRTSLSILAQLALVNPMEFVGCGCVRVLLHSVFGSLSPMVLEGILGSLLHLLNFPQTRQAVCLSFQGLVAPLTDLHFKHTGHLQQDKQLDERELAYRSSKMGIEILLRSWSGLCSFWGCGLEALVQSLSIQHHEIRVTILDLLCSVIGLEFPTWTDEVNVAISAVDPSHPQDKWKIYKGFIVEEAMAVLPHLATTTPDLRGNHMGLLVFCLVQKGLLEALVGVILTSDTFLAVRATVLLGEILSLVDKLLPVEVFDPSGAMPSLLQEAMGGGVDSPYAHSPQLKQQRALEAITVLARIQEIKAKGPQPQSVFLRAQVAFGGTQSRNRYTFRDRLGELQLHRILRGEVDGNPGKILKESLVLTSKDPMSWNWDSVAPLVKWCPGALRRIEDSNWRMFLRRLVDFYKPSSNLFDRIEIEKENSNLYIEVGLSLVEFLAEGVQNFSGGVLLEELLVDICVNLDEIVRERENPHLALWNPSKLERTLAQAYFLFLGRLSHTPKGLRVLEKGGIPMRLREILSLLQNDIYLKLILASLSYTQEMSRSLLRLVLGSVDERVRLYGTKFLRLLVRVKPLNFSQWGAEFLVKQLEDRSPAVALTALSIIEEAIHDKLFLESLIALRPPLERVGERGILVRACFGSLPSGLKYLQEGGLLERDIYLWTRHFNKRYVELVEGSMRDCVSSLRRGEDGKYPERASRNSSTPTPSHLFLPPHLYAQLPLQRQGMDALIQHGQINELIQTVLDGCCGDTEASRECKSAVWALAHFGTSSEGLSVLEAEGIIDRMVELARTSPLLSLRHTIFHALCLFATTHAGAETLRRLGWYSVPRSHQEAYPLWIPHVPVLSSALRRLKELDLEIDQEDEKEGNLGLSPPEEDSPDWLERVEEKRTPKQSFSRIRKRLSSLTSTRSGDDGLDDGGGDWGLSRFGSWRMRKSRSETGPETDIKLDPSPSSRLEPIQSSSSLQQRHSLSSSQRDGSVIGGEDIFPERGVGMYRSVIRRPLIRVPTSSDSEFFRIDPSPGRRASLREVKTGSLDRHFLLSPRDLFNESKLQRVHTSLTSISTPSYRSPTGDVKGPQLMGLCLPKDICFIFLEEKSLSTDNTECRILLTPGVKTPLRDLVETKKDVDKVQEDILRLMSSIISAIGVKTTEQSLLRLKQKYPEGFQDLGIYTDFCDLVSEYNVRLSLRRFLQELFLDIPYNEVYEAAKRVVERGAREKPTKNVSIEEKEEDYIDLK